MLQNRLKCRGQRKDSGALVEGYYAKLFDGENRLYDAILEINPVFNAVEKRNFENIVHSFEVLPESVGQFTNRHDIHGKEIFEHDILKVGYRIGLVIYEQNTLLIKYKKHPYDKDFSYHDFSWYKASDLEVIGNLIQTPEKLNYEIIDKDR